MDTIAVAAAPQPPPPAKSNPPEATSPPSTASAHPDSSVADRSAQIPSKHEKLLESFVSLDTAIRLLRMKSAPSTFINVSSKVQSLTKREFTYRNLAQLKFIFPEAIQVTKLDKSDGNDEFYVSLNVECVPKSDDEEGISPFMKLREGFRNRLANFCRDHAEGDEIPEAMLLDSDTDVSTVESLIASHFGPSFHRGLSRRSTELEAGNCAEIDNSEEPCPESELGSSVSVVPQTPGKVPQTSVSCVDLIQATPVKRVEVSSTPLKAGFPSKPDEYQATPAKGKGVDSSAASESMSTATPALRTPKARVTMSPDEEDNDGVDSANRLRRRHQVRTRSLKFDTPVKKNAKEMQISDGENEGEFDTRVKNAKEMQIKEDENEGNKRMATAKSLPKLFNTVNSLFESGRSVMTKEEVIHKIIATHWEIDSRGEVEEQLKLLGEVLPGWISERTACSGDSIFCVNKTACTAAMRARMEEAFSVTGPGKEDAAASLGLGIAV